MMSLVAWPALLSNWSVGNSSLSAAGVGDNLSSVLWVYDSLMPVWRFGGTALLACDVSGFLLNSEILRFLHECLRPRIDFLLILRLLG